MDDKQKARLELMAHALNRGDAGAIKAAGSLSDAEREYVSERMRAGAVGSPAADPVGTMELGAVDLGAPAADPDATGGA